MRASPEALLLVTLCHTSSKAVWGNQVSSEAHISYQLQEIARPYQTGVIAHLYSRCVSLIGVFIITRDRLHQHGGHQSPRRQTFVHFTCPVLGIHTSTARPVLTNTEVPKGKYAHGVSHGSYWLSGDAIFGVTP